MRVQYTCKEKERKMGRERMGVENVRGGWRRERESRAEVAG